ncbi:MAG: hypothetical protein ABIF40_03445, partial [archaeon]
MKKKVIVILAILIITLMCGSVVSAGFFDAITGFVSKRIQKNNFGNDQTADGQDDLPANQRQRRQIQEAGTDLEGDTEDSAPTNRGLLER